MRTAPLLVALAGVLLGCDAEQESSDRWGAHPFYITAENSDELDLERWRNGPDGIPPLASDADFDLCNRCYVAVSDEYFDTDVGDLPAANRVVLLIWRATGIIGNGGFEYLFSADFVGDTGFERTAAAFDEIGCASAASALRGAIALFPNGELIVDVDERMRFYQSISQEQRDVFNRAFWTASDIGHGEICLKLAEYIREHASEIELEYWDPSSLLIAE